MVVVVGSSPIGATITLPYTKDYHAKYYQQKAVHKDLNSILEITKDALNAMKAMNFHQ